MKPHEFAYVIEDGVACGDMSAEVAQKFAEGAAGRFAPILRDSPTTQAVVVPARAERPKREREIVCSHTGISLSRR